MSDLNPHDELITHGEVIRTLRRLEDGQRTLLDVVRPLPAFIVRIEKLESAVMDLQTDMKYVRRDGAMVAGGTGVLAWLAARFFHG